MAAKTFDQVNKDVQEKVIRFGRLLRSNGIPISKLVLFGSYAKNKANRNSDIDVCVVSSQFGKDHIEEMQYLFKQRRNVDVLIEPYPASPAEYSELESPIIWEIRKDGLEFQELL
ncbi:MAG TPA: nucleotidyltransferase domain-containing protein [Bacteroidia bacterium]|nr:nucleotidyltransferase domain-containing protein [Bacteroidia bacterium]